MPTQSERGCQLKEKYSGLCSRAPILILRSSLVCTIEMKHRWCNASVWVHFEMCKVHVQVSNVIILCYAVTVASLRFKIWIK